MAKAKYIVVKAFRAKDNFNLEHKEGDDVSNFKAERLAALVARGLVKDANAKEPEPDPNADKEPAKGDNPDPNAPK